MYGDQTFLLNVMNAILGLATVSIFSVIAFYLLIDIVDKFRSERRAE